MKPPKDLEEAREVGLEVDSEEEEMEEEGRADVTTAMNKVTWPETSLTQDDHGALTAEIMGMQLKTAQN
jgi:hypothetical protein